MATARQEYIKGETCKLVEDFLYIPALNENSHPVAIRRALSELEEVSYVSNQKRDSMLLRDAYAVRDIDPEIVEEVPDRVEINGRTYTLRLHDVEFTDGVSTAILLRDDRVKESTAPVKTYIFSKT